MNVTQLQPRGVLSALYTNASYCSDGTIQGYGGPKGVLPSLLLDVVDVWRSVSDEMFLSTGVSKIQRLDVVLALNYYASKPRSGRTILTGHSL